ncbi:MAG: Sua5/YciO/YrdC/YwlC family protein [candidate division SR1 bacterium]|nr:Sua5/YciO/YrdC/YwlC family protein [candidate division SR1 bacterium]
MKTITLNRFLEQKDVYINEIRDLSINQKRKIFVYPTDTIYGIGAIYTLENIKKIFEIKKRDSKKMFSIIAPSFEWIQKNYPQADIKKLKEHLKKYHGVTYIFDYSKPGVRIIKHPIQEFVKKLGVPFITTSCNISGEPIVVDVKKIPKEIANQVDYIVDGGILGGKPSVLIDLVSGKIIER